MRSILLVLLSFYLGSYSRSAQTAILEPIAEPHTFRPFRDAANAPALGPLVNRATTAFIDHSQIDRLLEEKPARITIEVPYVGGSIFLDLYRVEISTGTVRVMTDGGEFFPEGTGLHYRGKIMGIEASTGAFSFFANEVAGVISSAQLGDLVVGRMRGSDDAGSHVIYAAHDLSATFPMVCDVRSDGSELDELNEQNGSVRSDRCIRIYYELSDNVYADNGSDLAATTNWITAIHNIIATLFANDGITVSMSEVFIWTTPMPFPMMSPQSDMNAFMQYRTAYNGDVAFCVNTGGAAGAAHLASLCTIPYAGSNISIYYEDLPLYSFTVSNIAHEIGHVLGSPHTHDCTWNGNNTQIDDCGNQQGWLPPGPCYDEASPIIPPLGEGTIMSYCPGALAAGFGQQPSQRMLAHIAQTGCLGTDCITSCTPSVDGLDAVQTSPTTALITWSSLDPSITQWEVRLYGMNMVLLVDWTTVYSPSYEAMGLIPEDWHRVEVRTSCPEPFSGSFTRYVEFHIPATNCGEVVQDSGNEGPYLYDCIFQPRTFHPYSSEHILTLNFSELDLEPDVDFLVVHDGATVDAPVLTMLTGNVLPGPISSTTPGGALTVRSICDELEYDQFMGWTYTVSCDLSIPTSLQAPPPHSPTLLLFPDPAVDQLNVEYYFLAPGKLEAYLFDLQGRAVDHLPARAIRYKGMQRLQFDISQLSPGTYILRLSNGTTSFARRFVKN